MTEANAEGMDTSRPLSDGRKAIELDSEILLLEVIARLQRTNRLPREGTVGRALTEMMISDVMDATILVLIEDHGMGEITAYPADG